MTPPIIAPASIVANPNAGGIGQPEPSGVRGVAPKAAPITTPAVTDPTKIAFRVRPDVIILDLMMPRRNGLEVLSALRREQPFAETAVIVLTAQPATREEALSAGADVVMVKPFEPDEISAAVEEVLAKRV